jgi:uncharacterized protein (TIGR01777 family)
MTYLLTGATGFIGQNLCKHFTEKKANLRLLSRNVRHNLDTFPYPASFISWDHIRPNLNASDLDCDAVIHLAGENIAGKRWSKSQKKHLWDSRIESTKALVEMIVKTPKRPKVFICASAIGFYGDRWQEDLDELSAPGDGFLADLCVAWEKACEPLKAVGVRVVNVRSGLVLGLNQGALKPLTMLCDLGFLGNLGDGRQWMSWMHIDDWVHALDHCIQNPNIEGPVNFVSPKPIEHKNFMQILASNLGRSLFLPLPKFAAKLAMGEMSELFLGSQKVHPKKLLQNGFQFKYKTLDDALKEIFPNQGREYILERTMYIPKKSNEVFSFFTNPYNLEQITPPFLNFKVESSTDKEVKQGTKIAYKLKLHGIPLKWLTKIEEFVDAAKFVDNQEKGPYKRWHHTHSFEDLHQGTLMKDRVLYRLPLHWLGRLVAHTYVTKDVNKIFDYRTKVLKKKFYDDPNNA